MAADSRPPRIASDGHQALCDQRRGHLTRGQHRLGAARGSAQQEAPLKGGDDPQRLLAVSESLGERLGPASKHLGRGLPQALVGACDLERDRRDRAGIFIVGRRERIGAPVKTARTEASAACSSS